MSTVSCAQNLSMGEALDLTKGHLSFRSIPINRNFPAHNSPGNWFKNSKGIDHSKETQLVATIQNFTSGGYEVSISEMDLKRMAILSEAPKKTGPREKGEQKENDVISSIQRSKKKARHLIKSMGCDRLLTCTVRESKKEDFMTIEQWGEAWTRFIRLCRKNGFNFDYVAVIEKHKKGNYHMHAAINQQVHANTLRGLWLAALKVGKGGGNIDIKFRSELPPLRRRAGVARYVSKYITKQLELVGFNKKRYYSSKHNLPKPSRHILSADSSIEALFEISKMLSLSFFALLEKAFLPDSEGRLKAWFSYDDRLAEGVPF